MTNVLASAAAGVDWSTLAADVGRRFVGEVTLRTQISPPVTFDPFAPTPSAAPTNPLLSLLRPEVTVRAPDGSTALVVAPYGHPTGNYLPWLLVGVAAFVLGAVALVGLVARRI